MADANPTAAMIVIGNEILSGRTQDANLNMIAQKLVKIGIRLCEARVVPDITEEIVKAVNELRARYTYVFTTGGIGPTHDDITADSIARAFGVKCGEHPDARALLEKYYTNMNLNEARLRMARMPEGAILIDNPISAAPGFQMGNVFVLAGVPEIARAMMDGLAVKLKGGPPIKSNTINATVAESMIARDMAAIAEKYPQIDIGSYPWFRLGKFGTALVLRGADEIALTASSAELLQLARRHDPDATLEAG